MFKYIAEILAQFTKAQKVIALLMVLLSVIIISLAPSFIGAMTVDCEELKSQVARQNTRIVSLENLVDTLDLKIRKSQRECTNEITTRESEFIQMLEELKRDARLKEAPDNLVTKRYQTERFIEDTINGDQVVSAMKIQELPEPPKKPKTSMKGMINKIERMQSKIKNDN